MSEMNRCFAGSMPEFYDHFLVPTMFEPFARDITERLSGTTSGRVLELAAETGIVTRALARTLPPSVGIVATDLNPAMLAQARTHAGLDLLPNKDWAIPLPRTETETYWSRGGNGAAFDAR